MRLRLNAAGRIEAELTIAECWSEIADINADGEIPSRVRAAIAAGTSVAPFVPQNGVHAEDAIDGIIFRVLFNHENRTRVLEGKAAITPQQFITALRALS